MGGAPGLAAEKRVVRRLRKAGALSRATARPISGLTPLQRRRLSHLVNEGVVLDAGGETYYLDESAYAEHRSSRRRLALLALLAGAIAVLVIWLLSRE